MDRGSGGCKGQGGWPMGAPPPPKNCCIGSLWTFTRGPARTESLGQSPREDTDLWMSCLALCGRRENRVRRAGEVTPGTKQNQPLSIPDSHWMSFLAWPTPCPTLNRTWIFSPSVMVCISLGQHPGLSNCSSRKPDSQGHPCSINGLHVGGCVLQLP